MRADELGLLPPPEALYDWAFQVAVLDEGAELPQGRVIYSDAVQALNETRATRFGAGRTVRACSSSEASARASFAILRAFRRRFLRMDNRHFDR